MTKTAGNRVALTLAIALAGGAWLAGGFVQSPGEASVRKEQTTHTEPAGEGWLWSASGTNTPEYAWAETRETQEHSGAVDPDPSWDASLRLEEPKQPKDRS